ncbi:MAG: hypothetical protein ABI652_06690 [Acidobacteriota bacterium]
MGKRELLLIAAFAVLGVIAFEMTAAPVAGTRRRFTLSALRDTWRRDARGETARATASHTGTFDAPASLSELRLTGLSDVTVVGEPRQDIGYELTVTANAADDPAAADIAERTVLAQDDLGATLLLRLNAPAQARQTAVAIFRVPARISVRIAGARKTSITGVSAVNLDAALGETTIRNIAGDVEGAHRNGPLLINDAGAVTLTLSSSTATIVGVRGRSSVTLRNGQCRVTDAAGAVDADVTNGTLVVTNPAQSVIVAGSGGQVTIAGPRGDVKIDARRTSIDVSLTTAAAVTVLTSDAPLHIAMRADISALLDAVASENGTIDASGFSLTPEVNGTESRLSHRLGDGAARIALRNQRGPIVIRETK